MPYKSKKPCAVNGCPNLTRERFCTEHARREMKDYNKKRNPETNKTYNGSWRKISKSYLTRYPLCERCKERGKFTPADIVHHIIKITDGGTHAADNLMSLCRSCHSSEHASELRC